MVWLFILIGVAGFLSGYWTAMVLVNDEKAGTIRVDDSDPDGPYLFLEVTPEGFKKLQEMSNVRFKVDLGDKARK